MGAALVTSTMGLVGLFVGTWAAVAIQRWPHQRTLGAGLACGTCDAPISAARLPVVWWARRGGRCPQCHAGHVRAAVAEVVTAGLFVAVTAVHGWTGILPALLVVTVSMVVAVGIDLEFRIIPNRMTYPLAPIVLVLVTGAALLDGGAWSVWTTAVIAGLVVAAAMLGFSLGFEALRGKPGIGMGDVKWAPSLALVVGYVAGWSGIVIWLYGTVISGGVIALGLLALGRAKLASRIPYGPYLALGALIAILAGGPVDAWVRSALLAR